MTDRDNEGFPDHRDLVLQKQADNLVSMTEELVEWVGLHSPSRRDGNHPINNSDEFKLLRLRRLANNLWNSTKSPVAATVYGPSQVGKSLFMGRVLEPADSSESPLGKSDKQPPDAYIREMSFHHDLNPHNLGNEATALVTRFTTQDRFDPDALEQFPVKIRALTRAEWIRVLARGFRSECPRDKSRMWGEGQVRALFESTHQQHGADEGDRTWQMDLIDAYTFMRGIDRLQFGIEESMFNSFLSQYSLTEAGYTEIAGKLFWDSGDDHPDTRTNITNLFNSVNQFLKKVTAGGRDGVLVHWGAVKYLLDSQRTLEQVAPNSKWRQASKWTDFKSEIKDGWYVIDYQPGAGGPDDDLATIQSAMLEMIVPVVPHRLNEEWREVVKKMDVLDMPGMRSGGGDTTGMANIGTDLDDKMTIVKRGKVFYLIERYIEERQIQTMMLLVRGGNLEVRQLLKEYIDKWGRTRYGDDIWPKKVVDPYPALFIGMTGIDTQFDTLDSLVNEELFNTRLRVLVSETLYEVMTDFGGASQSFTNVFPLRYPGSWDHNEEKRNQLGNEKWDAAGKAFLDSEMVQKYVSDPDKKWRAAMTDNDGGSSLICKGFLKCTSSRQKQDSLEEQINSVYRDVRNLAETWYCDPNSNADRDKRTALAKKMLDWLDDREKVYGRVHAIQRALCFDAGNAMELAEFAEPVRRKRQQGSVEERFPERLRDLLKQWSTEWAPERWREYTAQHDDGAPWLDEEDFGAFARYLSDYLRTDEIFDALASQLLAVIQLKINDQGTRLHALREYVQLILNDFVMNPGSTMAPLEEVDTADGHDFGLMKPFMHRWQGRLPQALASAAGLHTEIPSGNDELVEILENY
jgi:hypothetical protein